MTLIVEDGTGVLNANSYVGIPYSFQYLSARGKLTSWAAQTREAQEAALVSATDYIDKRFGTKFLGATVYHNLHVPASNLLIITPGLVDGDTLLVTPTTYTFKDTASGSNEIQIGTEEEIASNIVMALEGRTDVVANAAGVIVSIISIDIVPEDDIFTSSSSQSIIFDGDRLKDGTLFGQQSLCFPRTAFHGIPETLKMATVEYAVRSLDGPLMPDPVVEETGQMVRRRSEKVGPIEEELVYQNSIGEIFKTYPEADRLIKPLITEVGGVYR